MEKSAPFDQDSCSEYLEIYVALAAGVEFIVFEGSGHKARIHRLLPA
jgi:hypothetical protein